MPPKIYLICKLRNIFFILVHLSWISVFAKFREESPQSTYRSRGALYVMVDTVKGIGVHPPPSPDWADFTIMMECTPESGHCQPVYSVRITAKTDEENLGKVRRRGLQRDVVYFDWPIAPSFMSPNAGDGGGGGVRGLRQSMSTAAHRSQNKLWRSNYIYNRWLDTRKKPQIFIINVTQSADGSWKGKCRGVIVIF